MISATGNRGFTLIEVLLAVALLSVGLVWILEGYGTVLNALKMTENVTEGSVVLHEKMADQQLLIVTGEAGEGLSSGTEGPWEWSTQVEELEEKGLYELRGEVHRKGWDRFVSHVTYVKKQGFYPD